jgi:hypothetical protein
MGMSSGMTVLDIVSDESGSIALTNLDEFGGKPIPLAKQGSEGKVFSFTASGVNGALLEMNLRLSEDGKHLRGNGKHAGFGARMELQRKE